VLFRSGFKSTNDWNKPVFLGGNINGVIKKFRYIKELGVNTIWISPFYKTNMYHGYHITDFFQIEPNFGTMDEIKELVKLVHENNMKIITDFVPNHCSKEHPFFKKAQNSINSDFKKWFFFKKWPDDYMCFLSIKDLPKLNLENKDTRKHIIDAAKYWLNIGFDGFRIDHVIGLSFNFLLEFKKEIKKLFPNVVLIGEAWMKGIKFNELKTIDVKHKFLKWISGDSSESLLRQYSEVLDGVLDFRFQELISNYVAKEIFSKKDFYKLIKYHYKKYPENYFLPTFLDNHDMNRFLFESKNDKEKLKKAVEIQFSIQQPAIIYYGTEIGMTQNESVWSISSHGDLQARKPMDWENIDYNLLNFYKKLIKEKKESNYHIFN
jgi:glycosidase